MARKKKQKRPASDWRYGHIDDPVMIREEGGDDTWIEFVPGSITHEVFTVRIARHEHVFHYSKLYVYKKITGYEPWISRVSYYSLLAMAEHVMRAIFASFQSKSRPVRSWLIVEGHKVKILTLHRELVAFQWEGRTFKYRHEKGECRFEDLEDLPPVELQRFFEIFAKEIWPALPEYRTKEERYAEWADKKVAAAPASTLFEGEQAPAVRPKKPRRKAPPLKPVPLMQPLLFTGR